MKIFDIQCRSCNYTWEGLAFEAGEYFECVKCGQPAESIISTCNFRLPGTDPGFPTAYDRWATTHERRAREGK